MAVFTGITSYYKLDETSGNAADSVGSNTLTKTGATYTTGRHFNGLLVSSTGQFLSRSDFYSIAAATAFTISFWLKLTAEITSGTYEIIDAQKGTGVGYTLVNYDYNGGTRRLNVTASGNNILYSITLGTANWYHIAITKAAGATGTVTLYVNAVSHGTASDATSGGGTASFNLGGEVGQGMEGVIDELGIWSGTAVGGTDIASLYNSGNGYQYPDGTNFGTFSVSDTETPTDSLANGAGIISSDTETPTDSQSSASGRGYINTTKNAVTFTNVSKS